jgi:hypothetical protein
MFRVTMYVTSSPTADLRTSSATLHRASRAGPSACSRARASASVSFVGGGGEGGADVGVDALGGHAGGGGLAQGGPVAVHLVEVVAAVGCAALGVDGGVQVGAARGGEHLVRLLPRAALHHGVLAGEAGGRVGERGDVRAEPGVEPGLAAPHELRVDTQAFAQFETGGAGLLGQLLDLRPGTLGVDVVDGERRDTAPVVDAGADEPSVLAVHQVGRGLDVGGRAHDVPGDGDGGDQLVQFRVGHAAHRGVRLGAEVLDDQFLDAVVGAGGPAQREQGLGALLVGLADADEQARGEGDGGTPGVLQDPQPDGRFLVRGAVVRAAGLGPQPGRGRLQHHAHAGRDRLQPLEVGPGEHARVEVREQARLLQDADRDGADVGDRVVVPVRVEPLARLGPAVLGLVAEGDQGFLAAEGGALAGDVQHLVRGHEHAVAVAAEPAGDGDEGAVVALVAAQPGQGDEDALGIRDDTGPARRVEAGVADAGGGGGEVGQVLAAGLEEDRGLGDVQGDAVSGAFEGATQGVLGGAGSGGRGGRHPSRIRAA